MFNYIYNLIISLIIIIFVLLVAATQPNFTATLAANMFAATKALA
ncbi:hypothetical protein [Mucilaginibacter arboris]|nr:hypothetical protein [Mucilaginibacter arboris]